MPVYCSKATHTWIDKAAAFVSGRVPIPVRWISHRQAKTRWTFPGSGNRSKGTSLPGHRPFLLVGNAGDVSTGAIDDLGSLAEIASEKDMWFHVDGAYGMPAAALSSHAGLFKGIEQADSIALDPHKWLYNPLEAGCTLVRDPRHLSNAYSLHPEYYNFSTGAGSPGA